MTPSIQKSVKWYRYNELPPLLAEKNTHRIDAVSALEALNGYTKEKFVLHPNAWMKAFGIETSEEVNDINRRIICSVKAEQEASKACRRAEGNSVKGVEQLKREIPSLDRWKPKKTGRRIFINCRNKSLRKEYIMEYKRFCQWCAEARQKVLTGMKDVMWPQGAFVPWFPPLLRGTVSPTLVPY